MTEKKQKCKECRFYKAQSVLNSRNQNVVSGLGMCSHLECPVIGNDEDCEYFKERTKKK
jgi:hypothetical protein